MLVSSHFHSGKFSFQQGHVRLSRLYHYSHHFQDSPQPKESRPLRYQALHKTWKIAACALGDLEARYKFRHALWELRFSLCRLLMESISHLPILRTPLMGLSHILLIGMFLKARYYSLIILHSQLKIFRLFPWHTASGSHRKTSLSMEWYGI